MTPSARDTRSSAKSFLDTSVAYKLEVGHSLHKEYLSAAIPRKWYVNNYVRMEFYRTCLIHWVELYFESAESIHHTFGDALKFYSERFGREPKAAVNAIACMQSEGYSFASPADKEFCRQKLQDLIFEMALQFQEEFTDMGRDPTYCARVPEPIKLPEPSIRDSLLRTVLLVFSAQPDCRSRCSIHHLFEEEPYRKKMGAISALPAQGKVKDALERIQDAIATAQTEPGRITCSSCGKMGDAIIASLLDADWKLHSMDLVHGPISEAIGLEHQIHPSLDALKNSGRERQ